MDNVHVYVRTSCIQVSALHASVWSGGTNCVTRTFTLMTMAGANAHPRYRLPTVLEVGHDSNATRRCTSTETIKMCGAKSCRNICTVTQQICRQRRGTSRRQRRDSAWSSREIGIHETDRLQHLVSTLTFISTSFTHTLKSPNTLQSLPPLSHGQVLLVSTKIGNTQLFTFHHLSRCPKLPRSSHSDLANIGQTRVVEITGFRV